MENYDDPFSPATAPFKRLRAYDWVDADYSLHVRDKALQQLNVGGAAASGDEPFYGDLSVDLIPGQPVRIPTVGPGARVLRMHANPELPVEMLHDGADNWFVRGATRARVHVVIELAIARDTFGREFADVDWGALDALEASRAANRGAASGASGARLHDAAFNEVAQAVGISRAMRPREVVRKMVDYFRSFAPSEEPPSGRQDIYLDLALSKKGVCRHRAFAFLVTALGIGVPARMVVNEAHAWVEIYDSKLWHRVDLGGAAANLENDADPEQAGLRPAARPVRWPSTRDSGQDLADRNRDQTQSGQRARRRSGRRRGRTGAAAQQPAGATPAPTSDPAEPRMPESEVAVAAIDGDVHRGLPLHLQGQILERRLALRAPARRRDPGEHRPTSQRPRRSEGRARRRRGAHGHPGRLALHRRAGPLRRRGGGAARPRARRLRRRSCRPPATRAAAPGARSRRRPLGNRPG